MLHNEVTRLHQAFPELGPVPVARAVTLFEFDDLYTSPRNDFAGAMDYYTRSSAAPLDPPDRDPRPGRACRRRSIYPSRSILPDFLPGELGTGIVTFRGSPRLSRT